jgi:hypothetical protein
MYIERANVCFINENFFSVSFMDLLIDWFANDCLIDLTNDPEFRQFSSYLKT